MFFFLTQLTGRIPARFNVGLMLFMACFTAYMLRTNISINLIAMVEDTNNSTNGSLPDVSEKKTSFINFWFLNLFFQTVRTTFSLDKKRTIIYPWRFLLGIFGDLFVWWYDGWTLGWTTCGWNIFIVERSFNRTFTFNCKEIFLANLRCTFWSWCSWCKIKMTVQVSFNLTLKNW